MWYRTQPHKLNLMYEKNLTKSKQRLICVSGTHFTCVFIFSKLLLQTCQQVLGCLRDKIYCVSGEGSNSYLSNGRFSITRGSALVHANFMFGWAERGGSTDIVTSGQNDSGIGQCPKNKWHLLDNKKYVYRVTYQRKKLCSFLVRKSSFGNCTSPDL